MIVVRAWNVDVLYSLPGALTVPIPGVPQIKTTEFIPLPRRLGKGGVFAEALDFAAHKVAWKASSSQLDDASTLSGLTLVIHSEL
jgi:hypothetical protein